MASIAKTGAEALRNAPFKLGQKQIFLPNHVITFIRPLPKQPPNLATFVVPLEFNKLDLRDYLWNVYNVEVTGVRSFVNQRRHEKKHGEFGNWRRPKSEKMMIAELVKPFVWPKPLAEEAREGFDYTLYKAQEAGRKRHDQIMSIRSAGGLPLPSQEQISGDRQAVKKRQDELLSGKETWAPGKGSSFLNSHIVPEEEGWAEVEEDVSLDASAEGEAAKEKKL